MCWIAALLTGLTLGAIGCSAPPPPALVAPPAPVDPPAHVALPASASPPSVARPSLAPASALSAEPRVEVQALRRRVLAVADGRDVADRCLVVAYEHAPDRMNRRGLVVARNVHR